MGGGESVQEDTIAAIATAIGEGSVGIVRVSGEMAKSIGQKLVRTAWGKPIRLARRPMRYRRVVQPDSEDPLDEAIILWMPGPHSYTGEDVLELQVHGGVHVLQSVLAACLAAGARMAEPGEFTKQAFLNGRMDLSQAEAVIDLIRAKTEFAGKMALRQVEGRFGDEVRSIRKELLALQAHVEVTIDYPEHDVEDVACQQVLTVGEGLLRRIDKLIASAALGRVLREGVATAIVGRPNVGKSSLLNALLQRERAIVTDIPGTTRDVLEEYINLRGIPLKLMDTAGIRQTEDVVERIGVDRSRQSMTDAELVLLVYDGSQLPNEDDRALASETGKLRRIVVVNKADRGVRPETRAWIEGLASEGVVYLSAKTGEGVDALADRVIDVIERDIAVDMDVSYMANARQAQLLQLAKQDLSSAMESAAAGATLDLVAVALQAAYAQLGYAIGEEAGEDLLDEIFSRFCLGK
ncbi:tRNA modification GTPase [Alicyclobacillus tengchongensis]|nr:tRNA modification GTPase [Alicyclobacillus tengchongensis]